MPGRKYTGSEGYRYGFNGKEQDKETISTTTYDYGFRVYSPALGKFLSVDPLSAQYPWYSPYQFAGNTPIQAIDLDGDEPKGYHWDNPYVASHPNTSVNFIPSSYDGQVYQATKSAPTGMQLVTAYAIQDVDGKCYLIYESAMGVKGLWYREYDKDGWKGNINSFEWQTPPDASGIITAATVGPLVALPGALEYGGALVYKIYKQVKKQAKDNSKKEDTKVNEEKGKETTPEKEIKEDKVEKVEEKLDPQKGKRKREDTDANEQYEEIVKEKQIRNKKRPSLKDEDGEWAGAKKRPKNKSIEGTKKSKQNQNNQNRKSKDK